MMLSALDEVNEVLKKLRAATQNHNAEEIMRLSVSLQTTITRYLTEK